MRRSIASPFAALLLIAPCALGLSAALADNGDVAGSKDYPGIGRFAGSVITGYEVKDFDATRLQAAPFKDGKATDERKPEGRITRIAYKTGPGPSIVEVSRNFETQLKKAGFDTLLSLHDGRMRRHSLHRSARHFADPGHVGRRLRLSLLRGPQDD